MQPRTRSRRSRREATTTSRSRSASPRWSRGHRRSSGAPGPFRSPCSVRRSHARRGPARGLAQRRPIALTGNRVRAPPLLHAQSAARALEGPDPRERLALRLRRHLEHRRDLRQLPPQEAGRSRAAADRDHAASGYMLELERQSEADVPPDAPRAGRSGALRGRPRQRRRGDVRCRCAPSCSPAPTARWRRPTVSSRRHCSGVDQDRRTTTGR